MTKTLTTSRVYTLAECTAIAAYANLRTLTSVVMIDAPGGERIRAHVWQYHTAVARAENAIARADLAKIAS